MDNNNNLQRSKAIDNMTKTITYRLRSGELQTFDVSKEACEPFGFYFGERAKVRAGKTAWVLGVRQNDHTANLYFHIDGDKGASYFRDSRKQSLKENTFSFCLLDLKKRKSSTKHLL